MTKTSRSRYTLEFKQEVVRLVDSAHHHTAAIQYIALAGCLLLAFVLSYGG